MPGHFWTANVFTPSSAIDDSILFCNTRIAVITTMMEKTPTNTPSSVSAERSLCAAMAFNAIKQHSFSSARHISGLRIWDCGLRISFAAQCVHRLHARGTPGGKKAGDHTRNQRNQD